MATLTLTLEQYGQLTLSVIGYSAEAITKVYNLFQRFEDPDVVTLDYDIGAHARNYLIADWVMNLSSYENLDEELCCVLQLSVEETKLCLGFLNYGTTPYLRVSADTQNLEILVPNSLLDDEAFQELVLPFIVENDLLESKVH